MFSIVVFFGFHCDSIGLAAARIDARAFSWQIIPACQKKKTFLKTAAAVPLKPPSNFMSTNVINGFCSQKLHCESL